MKQKKQQTVKTKKAPTEKQILAKLAKLDKRRKSVAVQIDTHEQLIASLREDVHLLSKTQEELTAEMDGLTILLPLATQLQLSLGDIKKAE